MTLMTNDLMTAVDTRQVKQFLTKCLTEKFCRNDKKKYVHLHRLNKDCARRVGQRKSCFRPERFYGLPSAQKVHLKIYRER